MLLCSSYIYFFFFFNDTATTEIYTLSLHDALPILSSWSARSARAPRPPGARPASAARCARSEEHTSELQSQSNLVCRLLLEKKKKKNRKRNATYKKYDTPKQSTKVINPNLRLSLQL